MKLNYSKEVQSAKESGKPILALESTIIAHGMPYPYNYEFAKKAESLCKENGVVPATIAILDGNIHVGLENNTLEFVAENNSVAKISRRELGIAMAQNWNGATTVSSTMHIAHQAGIDVFATGGIGGVHRGVAYSFDVSQDLSALAEIPILVISAGAKAILDLPKTIEMMETLGVTVLGYGTKEFPAFYSRESGCFGIHEVDYAADVAKVYKENISARLSSAVLVANPVPEKDEIPKAELDSVIDLACKSAENQNIIGKELTPFLLKEVSEKTGGKSLQANTALALNNIKLGAEIAKAMT